MRAKFRHRVRVSSRDVAAAWAACCAGSARTSGLAVAPVVVMVGLLGAPATSFVNVAAVDSTMTVSEGPGMTSQQLSAEEAAERNLAAVDAHCHNENSARHRQGDRSVRR